MALSRFSTTFILLLVCPLVGWSQLSGGPDSLLKRLDAHTSPDTVRISILNQLAYEYYVSSPEKSLEYAYQAITLSKQLDYKKGEAQALRMVGLVAWAQSSYSSALKNFMYSLKLAEEIGDQQLQADLTGNIGLVYQGLGEHKEGLVYHQRSLDMQRHLKNEMRESVALNNIGDVHRRLKNYDQAIDFYTRAIKLREKEKNLHGIATNLRNIGNVMEEREQFPEALKYYTRALQISDSLSDWRGMTQCRHSMASTYYKMKKYDIARQYALEGLDISKRSSLRAFIRDAYLLLSQISEAQRNTRQSFDYYKLYSAYNDSVVNLQVGSEITAHRLDYETQKKQTEIDLLKKDAQLQESIIDKKNTLLSLVVVSLVLVLTLTIVLFSNYGKQKTVNRILEAKNKEIEEQRDELSALNEEIRAQQEDVVASRDALAEKNASIAEMNGKILEINNNLEKIIAVRTSALEKQNQQLLEYAFLNAHKLRAPLARIMGLANLISLTPQTVEQKKLIELLQQASSELDDVTKSINQVVQDGLDAYQEKSISTWKK